jgi:lysophospholipase L1-like esterase
VAVSSFLFYFLLLPLVVVARQFAPRLIQTIRRAAPSFAAQVALALLGTSVCSLSAQTIQNFKIDPDPITYSGKSYNLGARAEKVVDFFTSTTTPSVVLGLNGTQGGLWFYQSTGGLNGWGANPTTITKTLGTYYERAKSIRFAGRPWPDLVVSAPAPNGSTTGSTLLFLNPLNPGGNGNPSAAWQQITINAKSGCHDIKLADMDGDGLLDVICTGGAFLPGSEPFIAYQTSNLSVWTVVPSTVTQINVGDGVAVYSYNGINDLIGCNGSSTYIWENPRNFGGNPKTQTWPVSIIGPGAIGNALGNLPGNMGVMVADSEEGTGAPPWTYGLVQFSPPSGNIFTTPWTLTEIDSTVRTAHEINGGTLPWNGQTYAVFAEQEQRSAHCNSNGYFSAPDNGACRVGYYTYSNGAWAKSPVIVSTLGTQNQSVINYNGGLLIAGANFGTAGAYDLALQLWEITSGGVEPTAPTPQISPVSGTYSTPQQVTITDAATSPTIYYTIDGSTPTVSSPKYSGAFTVSANTTVQAIATASGDLQSAVASNSYTFPSPTASPQFSPNPGTYSAAQSVTISDTTTGAQIYYTTDGSTPTTSSTHYSAAIPVSSSTTFKAIATATGFTASDVVTATYSIQVAATPAPTFSPAGGSYANPQQVTLGDTNSQAIIYYTTDGSAPTTASPVYGKSISVDSGTVTINAIALAPGLGVSTTASASYTIQLAATATPTLLPGTGTYSSAQSVTISDTTSGAVIYYTTNGATPTTSSAVYSNAINVSASSTLKALALAPGFTLSAVASAAYTIQTGGGGGSGIDFSGGFPNATGLQLNGAAKVNTGNLELTDGNTSEAGSAFWTTPVNIQNFTTNFTFQLLNAQADGFTFTLQNAGLTALGATGGSLGYSAAPGSPTPPGISNSVAIKFDFFNNSGEGNDSTGIYLNGANPTVPAIDLTSSGIVLTSGDTITAQLTYDGTTLTLNLTDTVTGDTFTQAFTVDIPGTVGATTAYAGFTGGSGGYAAIQNIQAWTFTVGSLPVAASPTFNPLPGTYTSTQNVALNSTTSNATIYYTLDGSTPTHSSAVYSTPIVVSSSSLTIKALAAASGHQDSLVVSGAYQIQPIVQVAASPAFNPLPGTYTSAQNVALSSTTPNATIYYTVDGSTPTHSSAVYSAPIVVSSSSLTIKALATASEYQDSPVVSGTYQIQPIVPFAASPTFSPLPGAYTSTQNVALNSTTSGATIYYTLDGSTPTHSSAVYSTPIVVSSSSLTIKALALASGYQDSPVASGTYQIQPIVPVAATPAFNPVSGTTFSTTLSVSITDTTPGATIYYTTDGSTPTSGSTAYTIAFTLSATTTVRAIAVASGYTQSALSSATYPYSPVTGNSPLSDEFNEGSLNTAQWQVRAPVGGSAAVSNGELVITVPAGSNHDASVPALDAVQVVETIGNVDFDVAIKIDSSLTSATQYSEQGLLVEGDAKNYIRFEIGAGGTTTVLGVTAVVAGAGTSKVAIAPFSPYAVPTYLRLQRAGTTYTAYWSSDGATWTAAGTFTDSLVVTGLGPFAGNYSSTPSQATGLTAKFDWFHNLATGTPAASPTFNPLPGTYSSTQNVALNSTTPNATIYYTLDGSTPTHSSAVYSTPIVVSSATLTIQALAAASGYQDSSVASGTYQIQPVVPVAAGPAFSPLPGTYTSAQNVALSSTTPNATIYYTVDGSTPTHSSAVYGTPIVVSSSSLTIQALATASGYQDSAVVSGRYQIQPIVPFAATPTFNPLPGTYTSTQNVALNSTTSGATIYYTLDGSTPTHSSAVYGTPIVVSSSSLTIKALAAASGYQDSAVSSGTYQIQPIVPSAATPAFSPASGTTFSTTLNVSITDATPGATIYYTTDGSTPSSGSTAYTLAFTISATTTVRAIAVAGGYTQSAQSSAAYTYSPVTGNSPVSDEFNETSLNTAQWQVRAPVGGSAAVSNGELVITVPAGSNHDASVPALDAVQVVETIGNIDFNVALKIDSSLTSATQYSEQGLLVEGDANDYVRFEIGAGGNTTVLGVTAVVAGVGTSKVAIAPFSSYAVPTYLRLQRVGTTYTAYWSGDGVTWTQAGTFTDSLVVTGLAPFAGNYSSTPSQATGLTAKFDWFHSLATGGSSISLMPLGDSITEGYPTTATLAQGGYRCPLYSLLAAQSVSAVTSGFGTNAVTACSETGWEGHEGDTIQQIQALEAGDDSVSINQPGIILLLAGTNDVAQGVAPDIASNLTALLNNLFSQDPGVHIFMSTIPPMNPAVSAQIAGWAVQVPSANQQIEAVAAAFAGQVTLVDFYSAAVGNIPANIADGVHPTQAGYAILADLWSQAVLSYLGK